MRKSPKSVSSIYEIELIPSAEAVYLAYVSKANKAVERGETSNAHITKLNMLRDAFRAIQANPTERKYSLAGHLSCIYRIKKGRMRICYVVSPESSLITILYISETLRKDGDSHDPYAIFTKMVMSGKFSDLFDKLGIGIPETGTDYRVQ